MSGAEHGRARLNPFLTALEPQFKLVPRDAVVNVSDGRVRTVAYSLFRHWRWYAFRGGIQDSGVYQRQAVEMASEVVPED